VTSAKVKPTSIRLEPGDQARADALCVPMARASSLDAAGGVSRHQVIVAAVRLGLDVLERKHGIRRAKPRK
jgi:hypothetical protein